jgi:hypothetical protein
MLSHQPQKEDATMQPLRRRREPRQQQLAFARKDVWESLPALQRERCQQLVIELLIGVIRDEGRQGGAHER